MNKVRRALLISMPMGALLGLSGCKIELGSGMSDEEAAFANGRALRVSAVSSSADALFLEGVGQPYFVPDPVLVQGCINDVNLYVSLWQGVGNQQRTITLTLPNLPANPDLTEGAPPYLDSETYDLASLSEGDALVVVTVLQADGSEHYEYLLSEGTVTVSGLSSWSADGGEITLVFAGVVGQPTSTATVSNNLASSPLQLDGTVRLAYRDESVAWLL